MEPTPICKETTTITGSVHFVIDIAIPDMHTQTSKLNSEFGLPEVVVCELVQNYLRDNEIKARVEVTQLDDSQREEIAHLLTGDENVSVSGEEGHEQHTTA